MMTRFAQLLHGGLGALAFLAVAPWVAAAQETPPACNVRSLGAVGDGVKDDSAAFRRALTSAASRVHVPGGTYLLGPEPLDVPPNVALCGDGRGTILKPAPGTAVLLRLAAGAQVRDLAIDGAGVKTGETNDGMIEIRNASGCLVDSVVVTACDRACVLADHGDDLTIRGCEFRKVGMGVSLTFSNRVKVLGNTVVDARLHGIQFWGNWQWQTLASEDLIFANNYVKNGGGVAIWGAGGRRVVMSGNIVDGANDVGLDLEWCQDSVITGNSVRNCENGGISLFYACKRITISGNTVANDREIRDPEATWFVRAGIWLTPPNRETYKDDHGHEDVTIVGNTIFSAPAKAPRRGMWIGAEARNILIQGNAISGPGIFYGGHHKVTPQALAPVAQPVTLTDVPTPDKPAF